MGFLQQGGSSGSFNLLSALTKWQGSSSSSGLGLPDLTSLFGATSPKLIFNYLILISDELIPGEILVVAT
jgi:hypothetical protein